MRRDGLSEFACAPQPNIHSLDELPLANRNRASGIPQSRYRAEVHFKEGGQNYDIMGWSKADVIHDVIDQYERHLHFLHAMR